MPRPVARDFTSGFVRLHILDYAGRGPVYGLAPIRELGRHGYSPSPGTLYPTLHALERAVDLISRPASAGRRPPQSTRTHGRVG